MNSIKWKLKRGIVVIIDFINSLLGRTRKDDLLQDIKITRDSISHFLHICVTPNLSYGSSYKMGDGIEGAKIALHARISKFSKFHSKQGKQIYSDFYRYFKPTGFSKKSVLFFDICLTLNNILKIINLIEGKIKDIGSPDILTADMTAKRGVLIRTVSHFSMISNYTWDLLDYLLWYENDFLHVDDIELTELNKKVTSSITGYAKLLSTYSIEINNFQQLFDSVPDVILNDKTSQSILSVYGDQKLDPFGTNIGSGFYSSPIYRIRLSVAEWQAKRYTIMKEKKKMLELKLMALEIQKEKAEDPKLIKEIEYVENRVRKLEHDLYEMER